MIPTNKFLIVNGKLRMSEVVYHKNLLSKDENKEKDNIVGGGRYTYDPERKIFAFYGSSHDFGKVTKEQFFEAFNKGDVEHLIEGTVIFSTAEYYSQVLIENNL